MIGLADLSRKPPFTGSPLRPRVRAQLSPAIPARPPLPCDPAAWQNHPLVQRFQLFPPYDDS